jgi:alpha/beta superfamily hydrolase
MAMEPRTITTDDGVDLEAELDVPDAPWGVVVATHPHPLYGGTMRDGIPDVLFRTLPGRGLAVLRFNFRGVGRSEGSHDDGVAERDDVRAAIDAARLAVPDGPLVVAGWSFGADVALAVDHPAISGWCGVAPPLRIVDPTTMPAAHDTRPVLLLCPENDQYRPPASAAEVTADWVTTELRTVAGADHFLWGSGATIAEAVEAFATTLR